MKKRHECPSCKGTGKTTLRSNTDIVELTCFTCEGIGTVSQAELDYLEWEKNQWCNCDESEDVIFYDDNEHPECAKHHWRHKDCGKIVQIG